MKRNVSLAVLLLLACLMAADCAGGVPTTVGSEDTQGPPPEHEGGREETVTTGVAVACGRVVPTVEPERARPGEAFVFRGGGFGGGCNDTNLPFTPEPPQQDVRIEMRQGGKAWHLATVDAGGRPDYAIEATLGVPKDAEPGGAVVATDAGPDDPFGPVEVPFEVLGGPKTGGEPPEGDEPVASAVAAACAGGGVPVDLVAEGTVQRVRVRGDSSLVEIRVERVLQGEAGETVLVKTNSGTGVVTEDDVGFEEGARYRLRLQRRGDVFTTNICLGTERLE